jgi:hypothetical protein
MHPGRAGRLQARAVEEFLERVTQSVRLIRPKGVGADGWGITRPLIGPSRRPGAAEALVRPPPPPPLGQPRSLSSGLCCRSRVFGPDGG